MKKFLATSMLLFALPLVASAALPNWDITGTWTFDDIYQNVHYLHTMNITSFDPVTGIFSGTGFHNDNPALTWSVNGVEDGNDITVFDLLVLTVAPGVTINGTGIINPTGTLMSGTGFQSNLTETDPSIPNINWTATGVAIPVCGPSGSGFEDFILGNVNGQQGWSSTGSYDQAIVNNTYGYLTFGCKSLRISDAVTSGSFGDQTFSPSLTNEAGETDALSGTFSGGVRQNHFEAQFDLASTMATLQPGMHMSVSPDRGDGARMSYLRFEDQTEGIHVFFDDVQGTAIGFQVANFVETEIAIISRDPHTIKFVMDFVDGPSNDVVKIYIDNVLTWTGTSWENYYRFDTESQPDLSYINKSRTVDSLLFRESSTANPANTGKGFLIDNLTHSSAVNNLLCPAAPAIAANLLKFHNVKAKAATNYISSVAHQMGPQTDFNNVHACSTVAYRAAIDYYLDITVNAY